MLAGSCQQALTHLRWRPSGKMLTVTLRCGERTFVRGWPGQNPVGSPVWIGVIQHVTRSGHYCGEKCHLECRHPGFTFERVLCPIGVHCPLRWYQLKMMQRSRLAISVFRLLQFFFCRLGLEEKLPVQCSGDICRWTCSSLVCYGLSETGSDVYSHIRRPGQTS